MFFENMIFKVVWYLFYIVLIQGRLKRNIESDGCSKDGLDGTCKELSSCTSAIRDIKQGKVPEVCSFRELNPIVCCFDNEQGGQSDSDPVATCADIPKAMTSQKTGRKAFDKCIEYQSTYVYPCERTVALIEGFDRNNHCFHSAVPLILGGTDAAQYEFPHMVMVGYGDDLRKFKWTCGGSIISERFILTAAHFWAQAQKFGKDNNDIHVLVNTTHRYDSVDTSKLYNIEHTGSHLTPRLRLPAKIQ